MEKKNRNNRKGLKKRLSAITLIYFDGISEKKKARLQKYLDKNINSIVNYYFNLLTKKNRKRFILPPLTDGIESTDLFGDEDYSEDIVTASEQDVHQQEGNIDAASEPNAHQHEDNIDKTSELNLNQHENDIK